MCSMERRRDYDAQKVYKRSTQQPSGCGRVGKTLIRKGKEKRAGKIPTLLSFFVSLYGKICNSTYSSKTTSDKKKSERETPDGFSLSLFLPQKNGVTTGTQKQHKAKIEILHGRRQRERVGLGGGQKNSVCSFDRYFTFARSNSLGE